MSALSAIMGVMKLVQALIKWASDKQLLDAGAKSQLADSLLATSRMVADDKKIRDFFKSLPDDVISGIMHDYYTRDR